MQCKMLWTYLIAVLFVFAMTLPASATSEPLKVNGSTQFLWGDDLTGDSQATIAQYLRFSYNPEKKNFSAAGYGRFTQDIESGTIRDNHFNVRLYYLYLDYNPIEQISMRLGRQYVNFSAGSSLMDGATVNINKIGPLGVTVAAGRDIVYSLDSETSKPGNIFAGIDIHLQDVKNTQLGVSYVRKYDEKDLSREEFGTNFRYIYKWLSPYAELKYDALSKAFDETTVGIDVFPMSNLSVKAEFYHSYPTFDSTSIFSVFAVDKFSEYLLNAEYSLPNTPVSIFGQYQRQKYEDDSNANVFTVGARFFPTDKLTLSASVDYRHSFEDRNWGFEVLGDYKISKKILVSAGVQYDAYQRPDDSGNQAAQRYWIGGKWQATRNMGVNARLEDDANETFSHRVLGRIALDWTL